MLEYHVLVAKRGLESALFCKQVILGTDPVEAQLALPGKFALIEDGVPHKAVDNVASVHVCVCVCGEGGVGGDGCACV